MHRDATLVCVLVAAAYVFLLSSAVRAGDRFVPNRLWEGDFPNAELKQEAPKDGVITDAKAFVKLWNAWRKGEAVPKVNFKTEFVFVVMNSTKGERPATAAMLENGDLSVSWTGARRGWGGWGYAILAFDRKGVENVNGVALEPAKFKAERQKK